MAQKFKYILLGGGNAAGYFASEYIKKGGPKGSLAIITDEAVVSYERPTLSKVYLQPDGPRLPGFYSCVGGGGEKQTLDFYKQHGIEYILNERINSFSAKEKKLTAESGKSYFYEKLIVGTGARTLHLAVFKTPGYDLKEIYYLRNVKDADILNEAIAKHKGKKAVVVGGGYIGLEVAAKLVQNGINVTMVFPENWFMERLFDHEIATFYEDFYRKKGVNIQKGKKMTAFEGNGSVSKVITDSGEPLEADFVVIGMGARPNQELFLEQLEVAQKPIGGIKTNGHLQSVTDPDIYAVGDMAAYPLADKYGGGIQRQEHVTNCRLTAAYVADELLGGNKEAFDYLPFFYSRVFNLSWQFYGSNKGKVIVVGDYYKDGKFGAYFTNNDGKVIGAFLESGSPDENQAIKKISIAQPNATEQELKSAGLGYATQYTKLVPI